jgi:hypothetical protein
MLSGLVPKSSPIRFLWAACQAALPLMRVSRSRAFLVSVGASLTCMSALAAGTSSGGWSRPVRVSAEGQISAYPEVVLNGAGDVDAVWAQLDRASENYVIMTSSRPSAGGWSHPSALSESGEYANYPASAESPGGTAVTVWQAGGVSSSSNPGPPSIEAAVKLNARQPWSRPTVLTKPGVAAFQPQVSSDTQGNSIAIWSAARGEANLIEVATFNRAANAWSQPKQLAASKRPLLSPRIATASNGEVIAVWKSWTGGSVLNPSGVRDDIYGDVQLPGRATWSGVVKLGSEMEPTGQGSASFEFPGPSVAVDGAGNGMVAWQEASSSQATLGLAAWDPRHMAWHHPRSLHGQSAFWPEIAASRSGAAALVWQAPGGRIETSIGRIDGCCWSRPQALAGPAGTADLRVVIDDSGDVAASWSRAGKPVQVGLRRHNLRQWKTSDLGSANGGVARLAIASSRSAFVIWQQPQRHPGGIVIDISRNLMR